MKPSAVPDSEAGLDALAVLVFAPAVMAGVLTVPVVAGLAFVFTVGAGTFTVPAVAGLDFVFAAATGAAGTSLFTFAGPMGSATRMRDSSCRSCDDSRLSSLTGTKSLDFRDPRRSPLNTTGPSSVTTMSPGLSVGSD